MLTQLHSQLTVPRIATSKSPALSVPSGPADLLQARTLSFTSPSASARCLRSRRARPAEALCHFHTQLQYHQHRGGVCPRRVSPAERASDGDLSPSSAPHPSRHQQRNPTICESVGSASLGPQSSSSSSSPSLASRLSAAWTHGWAWFWSSVWGWGWLGSLARFYHYYQEVLARAALTAGLLVVIRCGHFIPLPGVDLAVVPAGAAGTAGERLIKALYGQAQDLPASLFDLGISPFINSSILLAVALVLPPEVASLPGMAWLGRLREARKEGRTGEAALNSTSHLLALGFAVWLSLVRAFELEPCAVLGAGGWFLPGTMLALVAGSAIIHMCASSITAFGLGNGSSLVICSGIITEYASTLHTVLSALDTSLLSPPRLAALLGGYLALVLASVWLATSELRLQVVQYATSAPPPRDSRGAGGGGLQDLIAQARVLAQKKSSERAQRGGASAGAAVGASSGTPATAAAAASAGGGTAAGSSSSGAVRASEYFPLQLNSSGMMSIVLGGAAYFGFLPKILELAGGSAAAVAALSDALASPLGLIGYGLTVAALEFLPLGGVNPKEMAEYFNTMNVGLKGVVPGEPTERELRLKLLQCKFWGGACLGTLAVAAQLYDATCVRVLGTSLGTTSLLIIVGAVLQTARQVEGLLEGPKLQRKLDQERAAIQSLSLL